MKTAREYYNDAGDPSRWGRVEMPEQGAVTQRWFELLPVPAGAVVELGSGAGGLSSLHSRYVALDYSLPALTSFRAPRVNADMQCLPFADSSIACVFSWAAMEHVPRPEIVLEEIARVLAPGGAAILAPAWHCRPWAAEGLEFVPYGDLTPTQRIRKRLIPLRNNILLRAVREVVPRLVAEVRRGPLPFRYGRLTPNLERYIGTDCDAFTSMDPHAMIIWFASRGWEVPSHPTPKARLLARHEAVVAVKPAREVTPPASPAA